MKLYYNDKNDSIEKKQTQMNFTSVKIFSDFFFLFSLVFFNENASLNIMYFALVILI